MTRRSFGWVGLILGCWLLAMPAQAAADPQPVIDGPEAGRPWHLTFHDEFKGNALDTATWRTEYYYGRTITGNDEAEWYTDDSIVAGPEGLALTARPRKVMGKSTVDGHPMEFRYTSGMITTENSFSQTYGFFEMRARVPRGRGLWPAFWLLPADHSWPPEIDILEVIGHDPATGFFTVHFEGRGGREEGDLHEVKTGDLSGDFHVYGLDWRPGGLTWYLDGRAVAHSERGTPSKPMYLIANLAVGGKWPGLPDQTTVFPATFDLSYIRVWQRES